MTGSPPRRARFSIRDERVGLSLMEMLLSRFPHYTGTEWAQRLRDGDILINGQHPLPDYVLAAGDVMEYDADMIPEPEVSLAVETLYEDEDLMVVDKPAGLPCHPAGRFYQRTLWAILKASAGLTNPEFVNRLDRETSGLVVVGKHAAASRACRVQFERREVGKRYLVLVEGRFPPVLRACGRLGPDPASPVQRKRRFVPEDQPPPDSAPGRGQRRAAAASAGGWVDTEFRLRAQHGCIGELEAIPHTGRMHQIRATLEALGFPVVGDKLYGGDPAVFLRFCHGRLSAADHLALRLPRQALHAAELSFRHPRSGQRLTFRSEAPADLRQFILSLAGVP